jgi:c(7)-type cytochrome triheme protein
MATRVATHRQWLFELYLHWLGTFIAMCVLLGPTIAGEPKRLAALMPVPDMAPPVSTPRRAVVVPEPHPVLQTMAANPIYDESNPAYSHLQRLEDAMRNIKRDGLGFPDWMEAIRSGAIVPRASLIEGSSMKVLDLDIVMRNTKEMPNVLFPHRSHTLWLDCSNCHPEPFLPLAGKNPVTMGEIFRGKYCGMCHDRVAFITFFACSRCHSVPNGTALKAY